MVTAAEQFAIDNGETPIRDMKDSRGRTLAMTPSEHSAEIRRRQDAFNNHRIQQRTEAANRIEAQRRADEDAKRERLEAAQEQQRAARRRMVERSLKAAYIANGGTDWDKDGPGLVDAEVERITKAQASADRAKMFAAASL